MSAVASDMELMGRSVVAFEGGSQITKSLMPDGAPSSATTSMSEGSRPKIRCTCKDGFNIVALQEMDMYLLSAQTKFTYNREDGGPRTSKGC
jgi:hypothetical protein